MKLCFFERESTLDDDRLILSCLEHSDNVVSLFHHSPPSSSSEYSISTLPISAACSIP